MKFLKQPAYIGYVIAKLSKLVKISMQTYSDLFLDDSFKIKKGLGPSFQLTFFIKYIDKNFPFAISHELGKFHYQT